MTERPSGDIVGTISLLYELALSVGPSLDLEETCRRFVGTLLARKNLAYGAVWIKADRYADPAPWEGRSSDYVAAYAQPCYRLRDTLLPASHPLSIRLERDGAFSVAAGEPGFDSCVVEKGLSGGMMAVFPLGRLGFLKIHSVVRKMALRPWEINQLRDVVAQFAVALEGCLAHRDLLLRIEERDRAESARRHLALAVEQMEDSVLIADPRGDIQYVNPAFERITGHPREDVLGRNPRLLKSGRHDAAFYAALWATISRGSVWRGRLVDRKKNGQHVTLDTIIVPVRDERNAIVSYVAVQRDVTRLLEVEEQYAQAQKMESVGRLAGGIAHDFNNTMTAVLGFGNMILDELGEEHPLRHAAEQIVSAGERAVHLTNRLLLFSRREEAELRLLEVNSVLLDAYQLLRRALGEDVDLETDLDEDAGRVKADHGLLQQVVMNLAINARDAMPRGGRLTLRTARVRADGLFLQRHPGAAAGEYVLMAFRDTGCGMTDEVRRHAFEPFFTTKPRGQGTGLGLPMVYGIVRQLNGHIELDSRPGCGTEVSIWLPREAARGDTLPVELEEKVRGGTETILLVEDEPLVRDLTGRILRSLGYGVLEAGGGEEALAAAKGCAEPLDLLLTDVVMLDMNGPDLAARLRQARPEMKVLYVSGFTENIFVERGMKLEDGQLLGKPYTREQLARTLREVLDGKPA